MKVALASLFAIAVFGFSQMAHAHKAHEHGAAKVDIAFDGQKGVVQFESAADAIFGFEHEAKTAKDKKTRDSKIEIFKKNIASMIVFDAKANCTFEVKKLDPFVKDEDEGHGTGAHSEVQAEFAVSCAAPISGTNVKFGFTKFFPALRKLNVQVINGDKQTGGKIQNDKGSVAI